MRLLALDPAFTTGYCFGVESPEHYGEWRIVRSGDDHPGRRLERLRELIYGARRTWDIERIAFEESSFGSPNPNVQAMHNEHRGIVKLCASELGIPVVGANIATVKAFAVHGRATKEEMIAACERHYGIRPKSDDVADAIWIWAWAQAFPDGKPTAQAVKKRKKAARKKATKLF